MGWFANSFSCKTCLQFGLSLAYEVVQLLTRQMLPNMSQPYFGQLSNTRVETVGYSLKTCNAGPHKTQHKPT